MKSLESISRMEKISDDGDLIVSIYSQDKNDVYGAPFKCNHCGAVNIGHAILSRDDHRDPYDVLSNGRVNLHWLPKGSSAPTFGDTPANISAPAREAYRALDHSAYRAAILMARAVLEAICKDHGITSGRLVQKIDAMKEADHITKSLQGAAHAVRILGNDMAHGDFVKTDPTKEQAKQVLAIMRQFIEQLYEQPAQTRRLMGEEEASSET